MIPLIWCSVIAFVLITYKPAELMTVVGTWIGSRNVSIEPIRTFFYKWPRNFAISFAIEALIAQPIARTVLFKLHQIKDAKENGELVA